MTPSLPELCAILKRNYAVLDDMDKSMFDRINSYVETKMEAENNEVQALAWSMCKRRGLV